MPKQSQMYLCVLWCGNAFKNNASVDEGEQSFSCLLQKTIETSVSVSPNIAASLGLSDVSHGRTWQKPGLPGSLARVVPLILGPRVLYVSVSFLRVLLLILFVNLRFRAMAKFLTCTYKSAERNDIAC